MLDAEQVEVTVDQTNKVWVNVDGRCVVRVGYAQKVGFDDPERGQVIIVRKV